jgi:hypothetical protein
VSFAGFATGGAGGGGGGGARLPPEDAELERAWLALLIAAAIGLWAALCVGCVTAIWGTARGCVVEAPGIGLAAAGWGLDAAGLEASFEGPPCGPPGRSSLPDVIFLAATAFGRGVGLDCELGDSP